MINRKGQKQYHNREKSYYTDKQRKYYFNLKLLVFDYYGNACKCCGETEPKFLSIDHICNDGAEHRRNSKISSGAGMYRWIIKNNYPDNLQLLCFNCNLAKGFFGKCPHEALKAREAFYFIGHGC